MKLSIIIPTLNEEDYLPKLLASIKSQDFFDYEIIVADASSSDRTVAIAKEYGCMVTDGGLPAQGRNKGAMLAKGKVLLFVDADIVLPPFFLKKFMEEFSSRNLSIASPRLKNTPRTAISFLLVEVFYDAWIVATEKIWPYSAVIIAIKKDIFEKLKGYDEQIKLCEDYDLGRRAIHFGKFGIIKNTEKIAVSDRRFVKDGWLTTGLKYFLCEMHNIFIGPVRTDLFKYRFGHYKDK